MVKVISQGSDRELQEKQILRRWGEMVNPFDLKTVLLAKHAQHVVLIHFPIALFITAVAFDLIGQWTKQRGLAAAAYYNLLAAAISTLPVLVTGLLAWKFQLEGQKLKGMLLLHFVLACVSSLMIWLVWLVHFRMRQRSVYLPRYRYAIELLAVDPSAQFTAPNRISNRYAQISLSGNLELSDTVSLQAVTYYNYFLQRVTNGNAPNDVPCDDGSGLLCSDSGPSTTVGGATIPAFLGANPLAYSELDNQTTNTNGYGASVQATDTQTIFGFANHLVAGFSFDGAQTEFTAASLIGGITADTRDFVGPGITIDEPGTNSPVRVGISDAYYGAFVADTFNITDRLAVTASGRFNAAQIDLNDQNGGVH